MFVADCPVKRPDRNSASVVLEAANQLLNLLISEQAIQEPGEALRPLLLKQVESAIKYNHDGFAIGRSLYDDGWDIDAVMVDLLDGAFHLKEDAWQPMVEAWAAANSIVPKFAVGDHIPDAAGELRTVTAVNASRATYGITPPKASGKGPEVTYIVNYEELE